MTTSKRNITPCLWFDNEADEGARFYTSIFQNSRFRKTLDVETLKRAYRG